MAEAGRHRLLQLPCGADKRTDTDRVPLPRHQSLATHAAAAEPEGLDDMGADQAVGRRLAPATANPSPLARAPLRRQTPEVGAVCPNWARTDLCGGREVTRVPTAIIRQLALSNLDPFVPYRSPIGRLATAERFSAISVSRHINLALSNYTFK